MPTISPNPRWVRTLSSDESERVGRLHPNAPRSLSDCPTCKGAGLFRWYDPDSGEPVEWTCDCAEQIKLMRFLYNSGIEKNYQQLGWADADAVPEDIREVADNYRDNAEAYADAGLGLIFYGPKGTGKTMLSSLLTKSLLSTGRDAYFVRFTEMIDMFTAGWRSAEDKNWFEKRIRHARFLVLDDVGNEKNKNELAEDVMHRVVRARVADNLPSIFTMNCQPDDLDSIYSTYVLSLVQEVTTAHEVPGIDFRREKSLRRDKEVRDGVTRPIVLS